MFRCLLKFKNFKKSSKLFLRSSIPTESCGTNVVHDTEDFVYTNEVVMKTADDYVITLLQFRCVYEDKYIVSYEHGLKPIERLVTKLINVAISKVY